jgi:hypothetical protein
MSNRREFLTASAAVFTSSVLPHSLSAQRPGERVGGEVFTEASLGIYAQGQLTRQRFEELVGSLFMAFLDNSAVAYMRLTHVSEFGPMDVTASSARPANLHAMQAWNGLPAAGHTPVVTSFHLTFNTGGQVFKQGSYLVDHGRLGRFAMFLVPGTGTGSAATCGATFSYLTMPTSGHHRAPSAMPVFTSR